jgi:hypothetical protein
MCGALPPHAVLRFHGVVLTHGRVDFYVYLPVQKDQLIGLHVCVGCSLLRVSRA